MSIRVSTHLEFDQPIPEHLRVSLKCPFCAQIFQAGNQRRFDDSLRMCMNQLTAHVQREHNMEFPI
jgi:hypothetical protein